MRPSLFLVALGGILVGGQADASVLDWVSADPQAGWSDATCKELGDLTAGAKCYDDLDAAPKALRGPRGGVLLARAGTTFFEADPKTGAVDAVVGDGEGRITSVTSLLTPLSARRPDRPQTLISARIEALGEGADEIKLVTFNVVTLPLDGSAPEESTISFTLDTLKPTVGPRALHTFKVAGGAGAAQAYTAVWYSDPGL